MPECGGCTLCCELFLVKWLDKPAGKTCQHCFPGIGCKIQDTKPEKCREFECAYRQMPRAALDLRPDVCGVIFERVSDRIFLGTLHPDFQLLKVVEKQIGRLVAEGFSVVISSSKLSGPMVYLAQGHEVDNIKAEFMDLVRQVRLAVAAG